MNKKFTKEKYKWTTNAIRFKLTKMGACTKQAMKYKFICI